MLRTLATVLVLGVLLFSTPAQAQPGNTPPGLAAPYYAAGPAAPQLKTTSYRSHVMLTDVAIWLSIGAFSESNPDLSGALALGLILGGPVVHLAHDNARSAGYSLLARTGLPMAGALVGGMLCTDEQEAEFFGCLGPVVTGLVLGYGSALLIDWFALSEKTELVQPTGLASLRPVLQVRDGGAQAGFGFDF